MPRRLVLVVAHPDAEQTYENGWNPMNDQLEFITTNPKILKQCLHALDSGDEWVYVQRMEYGSCSSRVIGRVKVGRVDESAMRVWFENWEAYDAAPSMTCRSLRRMKARL
jgi:hypothetical protein